MQKKYVFNSDTTLLVGEQQLSRQLKWWQAAGKQKAAFRFGFRLRLPRSSGGGCVM